MYAETATRIFFFFCTCQSSYIATESSYLQSLIPALSFEYIYAKCLRDGRLSNSPFRITHIVVSRVCRDCVVGMFVI